MISPATEKVLTTTPSVSVEDLKSQIEIIDQLRRSEADLGGQKSLVSAKLENAEAQMLLLLEQAGLKNFKSELGTVTRAFRTSVRLPQEPADKEKLRSFLISEGYVDKLMPNSVWLNSLYKDRVEQAQSGVIQDAEIPGVTGVTVTPILSFRRT